MRGVPGERVREVALAVVHVVTSLLIGLVHGVVGHVTGPLGHLLAQQWGDVEAGRDRLDRDVAHACAQRPLRLLLDTGLGVDPEEAHDGGQGEPGGQQRHEEHADDGDEDVVAGGERSAV